MPEARMTLGILGDETNPDTDADVIMTAAVVGYSQMRLDGSKPCAFAAETLLDVPVFPKLSLTEKITSYKEWNEESDRKAKKYLSDVALFQKQVGEISKLETIANEDVAFAKGWFLLDNAIDRINLALGIDPTADKPRVVADRTPNYGSAGVIWIVGGTGDLALTNANRYVNSPDRSYNCQSLVDYVASKEFAGYKGPGAYTGMSARQNVESYIYSTFRGFPSEEAGQRWLPSQPRILGYEIKDGDSHEKDVRYVSIWGIIRDNAAARKTQNDYQMIYRDEVQKGEGKLFQTFVVGYTHGMIQAIYDVVQSKLTSSGENELSWGVPYELGLLGKTATDPSTTKMASCFYCGLFMEANGSPASSVHLGSGESWAPAYFNKDLVDANQRINSDNFGKLDCHRSIGHCNREWEKLCLDVLTRGINRIAKNNTIESDHSASFEALQNYVSKNRYPHIAANLILDSSTIHEKIVVRVVRTLKPPA